MVFVISGHRSVLRLGFVKTTIKDKNSAQYSVIKLLGRPKGVVLVIVGFD